MDPLRNIPGNLSSRETWNKGKIKQAADFKDSFEKSPGKSDVGEKIVQAQKNRTGHHDEDTNEKLPAF